MSVCLSRLFSYCYNDLVHIVSTVIFDNTVASVFVALLTSSPGMWRKNPFEILVYYKEYIFPILLLKQAFVSALLYITFIHRCL
jgi:hypothetical protein